MADRERVAYLNGRIVPESQASIPIRDRGFIYGDAVFDVSRTFNGRPFRQREHIDRLYASCRYLRLDPGIDPGRMMELTMDVVQQNVPLLGPNEDYWVAHRITRGVDPTYPGEEVGPTVLIDCRPLPLASRARYYRTGVPLVTPSVRRIPPEYISPRAKTHNYLNLILGDLEVHEKDPDGWALLLDQQGNLAESRGSNVFVVKDGVLATPKEQFVLAGITRQVVMELAANLNIPVEERDIDLYDAYIADEAFLTSTSLCICPVASINGADLGESEVPGPVTGRLMAAFSDLVGLDYVAQYLAHLG